MNTGHGHVRPRPDGVKARCGGPGMCPECTAKQKGTGEATADKQGAAPPPPRLFFGWGMPSRPLGILSSGTVA